MTITWNTKLNLAAGLVALALVSLLVVRGSSAAFTGATSNPGNSWDAGTVVLTDNDGGTAMFSVINAKPGDQGTNCIQVTYGGTIAPGGPVTLGATVTEVLVKGDGLGNDLDMAVRIGPAGATCAAPGTTTSVYTGTLALQASTSTGWTPVVGTDTMRPFVFTWTLGADTPNTAQGDGADATFGWSVSS